MQRKESRKCECSFNTTSNTTNVYLTNAFVQNQNEIDAAKKELEALEAEKSVWKKSRVMRKRKVHN